MNGLMMEREVREMQEVSFTDKDASTMKNGSVKTAGEVDGGTTANDGGLEHRGSSWRCCWRDLCSGFRALSLRRHWFVGEVIHLSRLAVPIVSSMLSTAVYTQSPYIIL